MAGGKGKKKVRSIYAGLCVYVLDSPPFLTASVCVRVCLSPQKWSKGKVREKLQNAVMFDDKTRERLNAEVPKVLSQRW